MVTSASVSSLVCTWLVAACMSAPCENHQQHSSIFYSKPGFNGRCARKRRFLSKCNANKNQNPSFSSLRVSTITNSNSITTEGFMSSSISTCDRYYYSNGFSLSSSHSFGADSVLGSRNVLLCRRQRRLLSPPPRSGETMAIALQPSMETMTKKKPPMPQRRVVVTGMGVETSIGHTPDEFYNNLLEGVSGISEIEAFDCSNYPTRIAGEIKTFSTDGWVAPKLSKRMDRFMLYMLTSGKKALADGGITEDMMNEIDKTRCGVLIGSAMGGMKVFNDGIEALRVSYRKMNPFCVPFATTNMGSAMLAMDLGWMGPNYSISTACATSNFCILNAANHIIRGEADMMLCGGSDAVIIPIGLGGFVACRALSERNNDPTKASRPWDMGRDGFVMGEGAGVLLLEELEHAKKRGATIYAEFLGGSFTCDAYHMTEPHPEGTGLILCMEKALSQSGVAREDVNYINAHATSTPAGDLKEYDALLHCFGQNQELRVNSTKSMIGHLLGAAGAVEAVATVQAIRTGWVHPNMNLENPEKGVDTNVLVGPKKERMDIKVALSNSFGFGGHNSSILFAPFK
ncbi:hypothetical protein L1887_03513 [Cichorium endivia]|nr:hypothetical protein L1887_03513 [Cichorium endivia]